MIEVRNLSKSYGGRILLDHFCCNIADGEFLGIQGKSGSGKSTLLNILGLLEPGDGGSIHIDGEPVLFHDRKKVRRLQRTKIGYLFQNYALIDDFSVAANLSIGLPRKGQASRIHQVLEELGLQVDPNQKIFTLSGGEQQRIALARVILQNKSIILADEPTASVDPVNRDCILQKLVQLNQQGKTIVLVSHDDYVIKKAHRIICL